MVVLMIWKLVWELSWKLIWERVLNLLWKLDFEAGYRVNCNVLKVNNRSSGSPGRALGRLRVIAVSSTRFDPEFTQSGSLRMLAKEGCKEI